jgi:hypothetical protein
MAEADVDQSDRSGGRIVRLDIGQVINPKELWADGGILMMGLDMPD